MQEATAISVLTVCVEQAYVDVPQFRIAHTGRCALLALRGRECDLVLTGTELPDMSPWALIERIRRVRPWQRWGLVSPTLDDRQEHQARLLGAMLVLEHMPPLEQLLDLTRRMNRAAAARDRPPHDSLWHGCRGMRATAPPRERSRRALTMRCKP
jgi:CheY-like chemotaxis protein